MRDPQILEVAIDQIAVTETNERQDFMDEFGQKVGLHVGKQNEKLIVRMHPDAFNTHYPNMTGAIQLLSRAAQESVTYRCNFFQDPLVVTLSFTPLESDEDRCRLPSER